MKNGYFHKILENGSFQKISILPHRGNFSLPEGGEKKLFESSDNSKCIRTSEGGNQIYYKKFNFSKLLAHTTSIL
jgi:hypothetical protein